MEKHVDWPVALEEFFIMKCYEAEKHAERMHPPEPVECIKNIPLAEAVEQPENISLFEEDDNRENFPILETVPMEMKALGRAQQLSIIAKHLTKKPKIADSFYISGEAFAELNMFEEDELNIIELQCEANVLTTVRGLICIVLSDPPWNFIVQSQSGTDKTESFLLAALGRIDDKCKYPQALILTPRLERALCIEKVARSLVRNRPSVEISCTVLGTESMKHRITSQLVIGTIEKVFECVHKLFCLDLEQIEIVVLDEGDTLLSRRYRRLSVDILRSVEDRQILLFSNNESDLAKSIIKAPFIVHLKNIQQILGSIKLFCIECNTLPQKLEVLTDLHDLLAFDQSVIFCSEPNSAVSVKGNLEEAGFLVTLLSGSEHHEEMMKSSKIFSELYKDILITTNADHRRNDGEQVTVMINFDMPLDQFGEADFNTYSTRIEYAGHLGVPSIGIDFVDNNGCSFKVLKDIQERFGFKIFQIDSSDEAIIEMMLQYLDNSH